MLTAIIDDVFTFDCNNRRFNDNSFIDSSRFVDLIDNQATRRASLVPSVTRLFLPPSVQCARSALLSSPSPYFPSDLIGNRDSICKEEDTLCDTFNSNRLGRHHHYRFRVSFISGEQIPSHPHCGPLKKETNPWIFGGYLRAGLFRPGRGKWDRLEG